MPGSHQMAKTVLVVDDNAYIADRPRKSLVVVRRKTLSKLPSLVAAKPRCS